MADDMYFWSMDHHETSQRMVKSTRLVYTHGTQPNVLPRCLSLAPPDVSQVEKQQPPPHARRGPEEVGEEGVEEVGEV